MIWQLRLPLFRVNCWRRCDHLLRHFLLQLRSRLCNGLFQRGSRFGYGLFKLLLSCTNYHFDAALRWLLVVLRELDVFDRNFITFLLNLFFIVRLIGMGGRRDLERLNKLRFGHRHSGVRLGYYLLLLNRWLRLIENPTWNCHVAVWDGWRVLQFLLYHLFCNIIIWWL